MKKFRNRIMILILCGAAVLLPWGILCAWYSLPLLVVCIAVTLLDAGAIGVLYMQDCRTEREIAEQIQLYWDAIAAEPPKKMPQNSIEWLTQLGEQAAALAEAQQAAQRDTERFLAGWSTQVAAALTEMQTGIAHVQAEMPADGRLLAQESNTIRCRTEQLMRFFRCEADCTLRRIQPVDLTRVMSDAVIHQSERLRARRIGLRRSMTRLRAESDPVLLTAVLDELLDNAIRHTPENGSIGLTCHETGGYAEITVEDAGAGIPAEEMKHIFERGFVGRGEELGHAGLGLFTARAYCELLGHSLSVQSVEGKRTRAVIRVRCMADQPEKSPECNAKAT